ncbi:MAG TPA: hypothetical protein PLO65_03905 [Caulobacter sp.]|nr:hypothetical protein [Caulobacter sp.]
MRFTPRAIGCVTAAVSLVVSGLAPAASSAAPRGAPTSVNPGPRGPGGPGSPGGPGGGNGGRHDGDRINVGNDIDIDIDTDPGWDHDHDHHPVAVGVAVGTALAIGSRYTVLPPSCTTSYYGGYTYYYCGADWYRAYYAGTTVTYVVVARPY